MSADDLVPLLAILCTLIAFGLVYLGRARVVFLFCSLLFAGVVYTGYQAGIAPSGAKLGPYTSWLGWLIWWLVAAFFGWGGAVLVRRLRR